MKSSKVAIIGAGPAGLAAAIQLQRYGLDPVLLERKHVGGLLLNANLVENYPGFPGGISGPALAALFERQAHEIGVEVNRAEVSSLGYRGKAFEITTSNGMVRADIVVVATGTKPKTLTGFEVPGHLKDRLFYEVYPLLGLEGKHAAIIGAGDAAFDYALNLAVKNNVTILNRGSRVRCLPLLQERAAASGRIRYREQTAVSAMWKNAAGGLQLTCSGPAGEHNLDADFLLAAIGREPQIDFMTGFLTSQPDELVRLGKLHLIGDVQNDIYRQTTIAVGDGVMAAMKIYRQLEEKNI